ncbi:MAG: hypothetical protein MAG715_00677 [Methanonatronarchaeales archaeon]|nr:hypothetical protein [Methanonatronarchaeales archaeon]
MTLCVWGAESARLFLVAAALGTQVSPWLAVLAASGGAFVTGLPITPAGLGVVEGALAGIMLLAGFGWSEAVSLALLDRSISYWGLMLTGGVFYASEGYVRG